jgi:hypothetical protein
LRWRHDFSARGAEITLHYLGGDAQPRHFAALRQMRGNMINKCAAVADFSFIGELQRAHRFVGIKFLPERFHTFMLSEQATANRSFVGLTRSFLSV